MSKYLKYAMCFVGVKFEPTMRSAPLGCDAAIKIKSYLEKY